MTATPPTVITAPPTARSRDASSGPRIARWYHRVFGAICAVAWASLALQIAVLVGRRGLLPAAAVELPPFLAYPTLFRWIPPSDDLLVAGCWLGAGLAVAAASGALPRLMAALQIPLYLSYAVVCRDFLGFTDLTMRYKPGPTDRAPPIVAPHQPRVDFLLWFYGLGFEEGTPEYVVNLMRRLCLDPRAVQPLFVTPLPAAPRAVEIRMLDTHFATPDERARGSWWRTTERVVLGPVPCDRLQPQR